MLMFIVLTPCLALGVADLLRFRVPGTPVRPRSVAVRPPGRAARRPGLSLEPRTFVLINLGPRGGSERQEPSWIRGVGHRCWGM